MYALSTAGEYWGGGGFILVPYDRPTGDASLAFADIVRSYDPDHVVVLDLPLSAWEKLYPGFVQLGGVKNEEERLRLIESSSLHNPDLAAERAQAQVTSWCSPMRMGRLSQDQKLPIATVRRLGKRRGASDNGPLAAAADRGPTGLAAAEDWRSDVSLLAAMRLGVSTSAPGARPEPESGSLGWLLRMESTPPSDFVWGEQGDSAEPLESWFRSAQRLVQITRGHNFDGVALVVGDTVHDFALALAYDRMIGNGVWLSTTLVEDDVLMKRSIRPVMQLQISELENRGGHLVLTSASVPDAYLEELSAKLQLDEWGFQFEADGQQISIEAREDTVEVRKADLSSGVMTLMADEHIGATVLQPVASDDEGSREALVGFESPLPTKLLFEEGSSRVPYWYVDVSTAGDATPRGRDFPSRALTVRDGYYPHVHVRSSKDGVTFDPRSMGFVPSGALLTSRIGRPRFRSPSMVAWVRAMAEQDGLDVRLSDAGRRVELVRSRLGSREDLLEVVTSETLPLLRAFCRRTRRPSRNERDPEVVVVGLDPYLSFRAIETLLPRYTPDQRMDLIDRLISARILRRGLVLGCEECGRPSFVDADRVGQQYECPQCGAMNALLSPRWKRLSTEPTWFYDLYSNLREMLDAHGDVVLLAAAQLRSMSKTYADTPELEFFDQESGKAVAEVDIVACVDGEVVLVEAKSNGAFGTNRRGPQSAKLMRVAAALRADRIVLATTAEAWNSTDVDHFRSLGAAARPFPVGIDVRSGLGALGPS